MPARNTAINAYIEKSANFAKPILAHFREIVHHTCPDVEEKIKWSMPFFDYRGEMMCHMAAFKQHCAIGFWKGTIMKDPVLRETAATETAMGHLGRITSLKDLPSDKKLMAWIKEAMVLNENGIKLPSKVISKEKKRKKLEYLSISKKLWPKTKLQTKPLKLFLTLIKRNISSGSQKPKQKPQEINECCN
jgi:hypothetical protein